MWKINLSFFPSLTPLPSRGREASSAEAVVPPCPWGCPTGMAPLA